MTDFGEKLLSELAAIKGSGTFVSTGIHPFLFPGLQIRNKEEISFPVNDQQIQAMIDSAHQAPFGKGSKTVLDQRVRSSWEIDASEIKFTNKGWGKLVEKIVEKIKPDLGIADFPVSANLYKLLIYKKGDFFVSHKDSEKEPGMFGTLIIGLPSKHTGGELAVRFEGKESIIDFSRPASQYKIPFAAFYSDCEHEIKPILSGYRVSLVYNLVQKKSDKKIQLNPLGTHIDKLASILKSGEDNENTLKIVLLGHQYTPSNFTMAALKLNDRSKAEALIQAAGKAGYYVKPGLVTSYQSGELEMESKTLSHYFHTRNYYNYYDNDKLTESGTMGEVYDESVNVANWMEEGVPPLRNIKFGKMDLISPITLNENEPIEKSAEGYTGNAGMEMEYWYHYGAIFLWPRKYHYALLAGLDTSNQLEWIDYYNRNWSTLQNADIEIANKLIETGLPVNNAGKNIDFSPLADWLINLNDEKYLSEKGDAPLIIHFTRIPVRHWIKLLSSFPEKYFEHIFTSVAGKGETASTRHLLAILCRLITHNARPFKAFIRKQTELLPAQLNLLKLTSGSEKSTVREILQCILELENRKAWDNPLWLEQITSVFTKELTREYVNEVLVEVILHSGRKTDLARKIMSICKKDLERRVQDPPRPPANWSRPVPDNPGGRIATWNILSDFLQSPLQQVFDYQSKQENRGEIEYNVRHTLIDLKMETIRKGSPHTLRITKTQDAYQRELAKWNIDVELLKKTGMTGY